MSMIAVLGKLSAHPGRRDEFIGALCDIRDAAQREPGTLVYAVHAARDNTDEVWIYEVYKDADAERAHHTGDGLRDIGPRIEACLNARVEIIQLDLRAAKGIANR
jgi:quinol monooxygenase YgiN